MAGASGMPGIDTTPTPEEGPASSLTAIGPEAWTRIGSSPAALRGAPETTTEVPAARVPVATTRFPDAVVATAS